MLRWVWKNSGFKKALDLNGEVFWDCKLYVDEGRQRERRGPVFSVFVKNLPYEIKTEDVKSYFAKFGEVASIHLPKDQERGRTKGFAFVDFVSKETQEKVLRTKHIIEERKVFVEERTPRENGSNNNERKRYFDKANEENMEENDNTEYKPKKFRHERNEDNGSDKRERSFDNRGDRNRRSFDRNENRNRRSFDRNEEDNGKSFDKRDNKGKKLFDKNEGKFKSKENKFGNKIVFDEDSD